MAGVVITARLHPGRFTKPVGYTPGWAGGRFHPGRLHPGRFTKPVGYTRWVSHAPWRAGGPGWSRA
eukprot:2224296-Pyramimonas_sp.AAC.2